ncbi:MAG: tetratricopeptide repeat protein [Deltaproteobacteria bacterium]|nr:tetratricopeptide repeat protein [Deltaproteobacteria bacterium]
MPKKCVICKKTKGKRVCNVHQNEVVCSFCCASIRTPECAGCRHHTVPQPREQQPGGASPDVHSKKHFIMELNEEVDEQVDQALSLIEEGALGKGKKELGRILLAHPRNHMAQYGMGVYYAVKGDNDTAVQYFDKAIQIFPYFVEAAFNRAVAYLKKGDLKNTIKAHQYVVEIGAPDNPQVKEANLFLLEADRHARKKEGVPLAQFLQGMELFDQGLQAMDGREWNQAIDYFAESIRITPRHPQSHGNMGLCYAQLGRKAQAIESFDKALQLDPDYEPAAVNRRAVMALEEGEILTDNKILTVNYHREPRVKKKSLAKSILKKIVRDLL